jgi:hypothetical protein
MKKTSHGKKIKGDNFKKLLDKVAKFREANQKYLLPNLNNDGLPKNHKIIQSNNTSDMSM